jgi:serine/threonine-protein kinase
VTETKTCPQCGRTYGGADRFCTVDGAALVGGAGASIIGTVIADRFLVVEKLGEGGMGEVYLAEHVRIKRKVALKLMRPSMLGDPVAVGRFHREAENASQISHPNVAQVYDFGETAERVVYLAMEFVEGEPLSRILEREGRLHTVRTAEIIRQTGEALTAAHTMGIIHRDLKPDNVMVGRTRSGTDLIKLVDFGIARAMHRGTQQFTSTGLVVGTPDYMSPEQLSGDELDARSDLYALALIAFRLLTGSGAYPEGSSGEAMIARLTSSPRRLDAALPGVVWPASLQAAFDKALAPDPRDRFADAMEFVAELDAAVSEMPLGEEEQAYLVALSQRRATPVRQGVVLDALTPPRPTGAIRADTPAHVSAVMTPPAMPRVVTQPVATVASVPQAEVGPAPPETEPAPAEGPEPAAGEGGLGVPRRGRRIAPLAAAGVGALALAAIVLLKGGDTPGAGSTSPADSAAQGALTPAALLVDTTTPTPSLTPAAPVSDSLVLSAARRATLAAWSPDGRQRGVVVLADSGGLALTAASLVSPDSSVDVFMDANTRVRVSALAIDRASGLATLFLPMRRCQRCAVVAPDAADPTLGDSVLILPAAPGARAAGEPANAAITAFDGRRITTSATPRNATGAPVISRRTGRLVALGAGRNFATPTAIRDAVVAGRAIAKGRTARDSLVPIWPDRSVRASLLEDAASRVRAEIESYRVPQDRFVLLVMTPQVMRYRADQDANPMSIVADPIRAWAPWRAYVGERRAVVMLNVSHQDAAFPRWPSGEVDFRNADVKSIRLLRNDTLVVPIETGAFPALTSNGRREIGASAIAVYSPFDFRRGGNYRVEVSDARGSVTRIPVRVGALEHIQSDFSWLLGR